MTDKLIGIGLVGLGRAGWGMHVPIVEKRLDKFRYAAACDVEQDRLERMAGRFGCKTYRNIEDLIADPDVELVDVTSRSPDHAPHAILALRAGKHVLVEKPLSVTYQDAKKIKAAADRSKGKLFVNHNRRFEPAFNHIREIMASGILGKVYEIKLRRLGYQRRDDWQTLKQCGGGQLLNWGPHIIDHALQFLGGFPAKIWSDLKRVAARGDAEDHLKICMTGADGLIVDIEISGGAAIREPEYIIFGSKGGLTCDGSQIALRYLDPKAKLAPRKATAQTPPQEGGFGSPDKLVWIEETIPVAPKKPVVMEALWDHLYDAIRKGRKFPITTEESLNVMRVVSAVKKGTQF
ncbi:MAG: Gfo/Idh/MocA family oxidoreductase [Candidatus Sumerlaeota bacterium]|nr:Gfo/Idh/MocA family oxidoreductase [Candidatus Sumerlaeota bacterium]